MIEKFKIDKTNIIWDINKEDVKDLLHRFIALGIIPAFLFIVFVYFDSDHVKQNSERLVSHLDAAVNAIWIVGSLFLLQLIIGGKLLERYVNYYTMTAFNAFSFLVGILGILWFLGYLKEDHIAVTSMIVFIWGTVGLAGKGVKSKVDDIPFDKIIDRTKTNAEKYTFRERLFGTTDVLPMWVADMDIETPPCVIEAIQQRLNHPLLGYEEMPDSAFDAQINWMQQRHGWHLEREWMRFSPSVVATINACIEAFTEPGDGVVVQTPVYSPFFKSVAHHGRQTVLNPLKRLEDGDYTFDFEDLEAKIDAKTKLLLLCSPHNPVGRVWRREELLRLAEICANNGIIVLADEVHSDLIFAPHHHTPFASLHETAAAMTVTAIGPGKSFNVAGLSISSVVISDAALQKRFGAVYEGIHFAQGTVLGHVGFEAAYRNGAAWLDGLLEHLRCNVAKLEAVVAKYPDTIQFRAPEGTYLVWLDCAALQMSGKGLRHFFINEAKLGLSPGISFGREGEGFMRMNIAVPTPVMDEALKRLEQALAGLKG